MSQSPFQVPSTYPTYICKSYFIIFMSFFLPIFLFMNKNCYSSGLLSRIHKNPMDFHSFPSDRVNHPADHDHRSAPANDSCSERYLMGKVHCKVLSSLSNYPPTIDRPHISFEAKVKHPLPLTSLSLPHFFLIGHFSQQSSLILPQFAQTIDSIRASILHFSIF